MNVDTAMKIVLKVQRTAKVKGSIAIAMYTSIVNMHILCFSKKVE